ncbi:UNVERIFIED_CONTAM: hypothetical protein H355_008810, partial [Colinus virginianus]
GDHKKSCTPLPAQARGEREVDGEQREEKPGRNERPCPEEDHKKSCTPLPAQARGEREVDGGQREEKPGRNERPCPGQEGRGGVFVMKQIVHSLPLSLRAKGPEENGTEPQNPPVLRCSAGEIFQLLQEYRYKDTYSK